MFTDKEISELWVQYSTDVNCVTMPDGSCMSVMPCMHSEFAPVVLGLIHKLVEETARHSCEDGWPAKLSYALQVYGIDPRTWEKK